MSEDHYKFAEEMEEEYDYILTFNSEYVDRGEKWLYYPLGGSWIPVEKWGIKTKSRMITMIASGKNTSTGHRLRHRIASMSGLHGIDVYGRAYNPILSKEIGLANHRYAIVVESVKLPGYFSEKLIDAISQGCVPIYWGDPHIEDTFDIRGILPFDTQDDLVDILVNVCSEWDYSNRLSAIGENFNTAAEYRCAEDWIAKTYPFVVEE